MNAKNRACSSCGKQTRDDLTYCTVCGNTMTPQGPVPTTTAPPGERVCGSCRLPTPTGLPYCNRCGKTL